MIEDKRTKFCGCCNSNEELVDIKLENKIITMCKRCVDDIKRGIF